MLQLFAPPLLWLAKRIMETRQLPRKVRNIFSFAKFAGLRSLLGRTINSSFLLWLALHVSLSWHQDNTTLDQDRHTQAEFRPLVREFTRLSPLKFWSTDHSVRRTSSSDADQLYPCQKLQAKISPRAFPFRLRVLAS